MAEASINMFHQQYYSFGGWQAVVRSGGGGEEGVWGDDDKFLDEGVGGESRRRLDGG